MADTRIDLIKDIEKRMTALGYENFNELYNQEHDLKSLKELKRRLMDEAKALREFKKEKTRLTKDLKSLLIKLNKVYRKDLYIYNGIYSIPGVISQESLKGKFIIKIKDEFEECMKEILFKNETNELIFIRDISELKSLVEENLEDKDIILSRAKESGVIEVCDEEKTNSLVLKMNDELELIKNNTELFISLFINDEEEPDIINMKKKFSIKYKDFPEIEGNIQLFPFYTEKDKPYIEFMSDEFEDNGSVKLYYAIFHIDYSYFDIFSKIYYF